MNNHNGVQAGANPQEGVQAGANPQGGVQAGANPQGGVQAGANPQGGVQAGANPQGGVQAGANPQGGVQAGANPQGGVQAGANPQGVQVVANPNIGLLNPSAVPVLDPTNVKTTIMGQLASYQPYATNLANHLDRIRPLNGGRASPIFNNNIYPSDRD